MDSSKARAFTAPDGAILAGATALGVAWIREFAVNALGRGPGPSAGELGRYAAALAFVGLPFVLLWSLALVAIRLRRPRGRLGGLVRSPGVAACAVVSLGTLVGALVILPAPLMAWLRGAPRGWPEPLAATLAEGLALMAPLLGLAVALTWTALALGRRWAPGPCWIDRAGIALGFVWLSMVPVLAGFWLVGLLG